MPVEPITLTIAIIGLVATVITLGSNIFQSINDGHFKSSCMIGIGSDSSSD